jgi:hypothetical protein
MIEKKNWHVTTVEGVFVKDYATFEEAEASAQDRNLRAVDLGSSARYAAVEAPA